MSLVYFCDQECEEEFNPGVESDVELPTLEVDSDAETDEDATERGFIIEDGYISSLD